VVGCYPVLLSVQVPVLAGSKCSLALRWLGRPRAECDSVVCFVLLLFYVDCLQAYGEGVVLEWLRKAPPIIRMEEEVRSCVLFDRQLLS
jgi:hypothetical protein